jgi:hypothetical protein
LVTFALQVYYMTDKEAKKKKVTKTRNWSVRFDQKLYDEICEKHGFDRAQEVLNHLEFLYRLSNGQEFSTPTLDRQPPKIAKSVEKKPIKASEMSDEDAARVAVLQAEIEKGPPKEFSTIGKKSYLHDRNKEINAIKAKYESK